MAEDCKGLWCHKGVKISNKDGTRFVKSKNKYIWMGLRLGLRWGRNFVQVLRFQLNREVGVGCGGSGGGYVLRALRQGYKKG